MPDFCGVPQCKSSRKSGISLHKIPPEVIDNQKEILKWKLALKIKKPLSKNFKICSLHFNKKYILSNAISKSKRVKTILVSSAFPTENLPISTNSRIEQVTTSDYLSHSELSSSPDESFSQNETEPSQKKCKSVEVQTEYALIDEYIQTSNNLPHNSLPFSIDTDRKLNIMTGISSMDLLDNIVQCISRILSKEKRSSKTIIRDRIILTMYRIKNNTSNAHTAILFNLDTTTAKKYFLECVELLAKVLKPGIGKMENLKTRDSAGIEAFDHSMTFETEDCEVKEFMMLSEKTAHYNIPYMKDIRAIANAFAILS